MINKNFYQDFDQLDISNEKIREMVRKGRIKAENSSDIFKNKILQKDKLKTSINFLKQIEDRKWLIKHGKRYLIDFDDQERKEMKKYFDAMEHTSKGQNKTGSIGFQQLQQLLISVGLAENRQQVRKMMMQVDEDGSNKIQFNEFLKIIKSDVNAQNQQLINFFKKIITNDMEQYIPKGTSFQMMISMIRRKKMLEGIGIRNADQKKRKEGMKILKAFNRLQNKRNKKKNQ